MLKVKKKKRLLIMNLSALQVILQEIPSAVLTKTAQVRTYKFVYECILIAFA